MSYAGMVVGEHASQVSSSEMVAGEQCPPGLICWNGTGGTDDNNRVVGDTCKAKEDCEQGVANRYVTAVDKVPVNA